MSEVLEPRPCHLCGGPRLVSYIDPERHPGNLLCAKCAGVEELPDMKQVMLLLCKAIEADGIFERRTCVREARVLLEVGVKL